MKKIEVVTTYTVKKTFTLEVEDNESLDIYEFNEELLDPDNVEDEEYWESTETIESIKEV